VAGTQDFAPDARNSDVHVYLNGEFVHRDEAKVSIFDSGFILGDGIWEGFRMHGGRLAFMERHLDRLFMGARAIDMDIGLTRDAVKDALRATLERNDMDGAEGVHVRLMVTRGLKKTPNQDPRHTISKATVVIVPEFKVADPAVLQTGLKLFTSAVRCSRADMFDMRLNSHSRLNLIIALIQAIKAGADEALMLDDRGYVSSCNATNFFIVKDGAVMTSTGTSCFNGITRANVIEVCAMNGIRCDQRDFTLSHVYDADEVFVTGSFGGLTPVSAVDGRRVAKVFGPVTTRLRELYVEYAKTAD
jgi:branched-chain amino acid aminotransferase